MRVLFVSALPPERPSMIGRLLPLASAVARSGHQVELVTLSGKSRPPFTAADEHRGFPVRTVGPSIRPTDDQLPNLSSSLLRWYRGRRALERVLRQTRADVVVLAKPQLQNTPPTLRHVRDRARPLIVDIDDLEAVASRLPPPIRSIAARLEREAIRHANAVTACSPYLVDYAKHWNPHASIRFLPTGIDRSDHAAPARLRERLEVPSTARIVLYVGSLSRPSGHRVDLLLEAFRNIVKRADEARRPEELHLVIAGEGIDEAVLREQSRSRGAVGSRVHFVGSFRPPEDLAMAAAADLLVDPVDAGTVTEAKSSHRTMLALATGTPIVAGRIGIRPVLLPAALHSACLYDPLNPSALASAIERALLDRTFTDTFRQRTAGLAHQWTWKTLGEQFVSTIETVTRKTT